MFMFVQKLQSTGNEGSARFWLDPEAEVALSARINEHFPQDGDQVPGATYPNGKGTGAEDGLMDCFRHDSELVQPVDRPTVAMARQAGKGRP